MVPIYDTDVAEERWSQSEWEHYELWEKVELKLRRQKRIWILATFVVVLALFSIPIVADRKPKWIGLAASRRLAQEINSVKREASLNHGVYRIRFTDAGTVSYLIEKVSACNDPPGSAEIVRRGSLIDGFAQSSFAILDRRNGEQFRIPGLVSDFCYDSFSGNASHSRGEGVTGFGIIPAKDLTEGRLDRVSLVILNGPSAEISVD